ncbi:MAG: hypothetical protein ABSG85_11475 [Spirochaetia bacterium]|jgi:hypothetical protein
MRKPRTGHGQGAWDDQRLETYLDGVRENARAPHGFAQRVMNAVYRESLAARPLPAAALPGRAAAPGTTFGHTVSRSHPTASRMYRRIGLSFLLTAAVLAASLLVPHGAYPMLIGSGVEAVLGAGPSEAVQNALLGAGHAVQGALGESHIGGDQE